MYFWWPCFHHGERTGFARPFESWRLYRSLHSSESRWTVGLPWIRWFWVRAEKALNVHTARNVLDKNLKLSKRVPRRIGVPFFSLFPCFLHEFDRYLEKEDAYAEPGCRFAIHCHYAPRCLRSACWRRENIAGASSSIVVMEAWCGIRSVRWLELMPMPRISMLIHSFVGDVLFMGYASSVKK